MINESSIFILKVLRKLYRLSFGTDKNLYCIEDAEIASKLIVEQLTSKSPCMIARFGATELTCIINYLGIKNGADPINFIRGKTGSWWWEQSIANQMQNWSGFFPPTINNLKHFSELMLEDKQYVDILGSWMPEDNFLAKDMNISKIALRYLEPFYTDIPWTKALEGKKVLVIHPFAQTILSQYEKRELLFKNQDTLPTFASLSVIKAVQSLGGDNNQFRDWFEALEHMKSQMDQADYDVCLIGAGAYGFPLAAHAKRMGKKGLHIGGALQLFFGIRGKRWEDPEYGIWWGLPRGFYSDMMNKYWVRADKSDRPKNAENVEGATYW
jgi:hypothetical protein